MQRFDLGDVARQSLARTLTFRAAAALLSVGRDRAYKAGAGLLVQAWEDPLANERIVERYQAMAQGKDYELDTLEKATLFTTMSKDLGVALSAIQEALESLSLRTDKLPDDEKAIQQVMDTTGRSRSEIEKLQAEMAVKQLRRNQDALPFAIGALELIYDRGDCLRG